MFYTTITEVTGNISITKSSRRSCVCESDLDIEKVGKITLPNGYPIIVLSKQENRTQRF